MAMREIPAAFEFTCDGCGVTRSGRTKDRPAYWGELILAQDAYDYQGCAVADGTIRHTLCDECRRAVIATVNTAIAARASLQTGEKGE